MTRLRRLAEGFARHRGQLALAGFLVLAIVCLNIVRPILMKVTVDDLLPAGRPAEIALLVAAIVGASLLQGLLNASQTTLVAVIGVGISSWLRRRLYERLIRAPLAYLARWKTGELTYVLPRECGRIGEVFVSQELIPGAAAAVMASAFAVAMWLLDARLALVALATLPWVHVVMRLVTPYLRRLEDDYSRLLGRGEAFLQETVGNVKTVQLFCQEERERGRWDRWLGEFTALYRRQSISRYLARSALQRLADAIGTSIVFGVGLLLASRGSLTLGTVFAFIALLPQLHAEAELVQRALAGAATVQPALERVFRHLDMPVVDASQPPVVRHFETAGPRIALADSASRAAIAFRNVTFTYDDGRPGLRDVSFEIAPGERVALIGPSGGGKSTIFDLVLRFYEPQQGAVFVGGRDVRDIPLAELRRQVVLVQQDSMLWNTTIRENIRYGRPEASDEAVVRAARLAQIERFVDSLERTYDTVVGERGNLISGGERQRVSVARALLVDAPILLLDEATSALDAATEAALLARLAAELPGRTMVAAAHRPAVAEAADRVLVVENGRLVGERGSGAQRA